MKNKLKLGDFKVQSFVISRSPGNDASRMFVETDYTGVTSACNPKTDEPKVSTCGLSNTHGCKTCGSDSIPCASVVYNPKNQQNSSERLYVSTEYTGPTSACNPKTDEPNVSTCGASNTHGCKTCGADTIPCSTGGIMHPRGLSDYELKRD